MPDRVTDPQSPIILTLPIPFPLSIDALEKASGKLARKMETMKATVIAFSFVMNPNRIDLMH